MEGTKELSRQDEARGNKGNKERKGRLVYGKGGEEEGRRKGGRDEVAEPPESDYSQCKMMAAHHTARYTYI